MSLLFFVAVVVVVVMSIVKDFYFLFHGSSFTLWDSRCLVMIHSLQSIQSSVFIIQGLGFTV